MALLPPNQMPDWKYLINLDFNMGISEWSRSQASRWLYHYHASPHPDYKDKTVMRATLAFYERHRVSQIDLITIWSTPIQRFIILSWKVKAVQLIGYDGSERAAVSIKPMPIQVWFITTNNDIVCGRKRSSIVLQKGKLCRNPVISHLKFQCTSIMHQSHICIIPPDTMAQ